MSSNLARMISQPEASGLVIRGIHGFEIGIERGLCIYYYDPAIRQPNDHIGSQLSVFSIDGMLLVEIAVRDHAGEFDCSLQLNLAPNAANGGRAERLHQIRGLQL